MSRAKELMTGGKGITRRNAIYDIAAERLSGKPTERFSNMDMERGLELESFALKAYEKIRHIQVTRIGSIWLDERKTIGGSPDGIASDGKLIVEVKCPRPRNHMRWIMDPDGNGHAEQMQGNLWVSGANACDFVSFCPEFAAVPIFVHRVGRDEELIEKVENAAIAADFDAEEIVRRARNLVPTEDLLSIDPICASALRHLDALFGDAEVQPSE